MTDSRSDASGESAVPAPNPIQQGLKLDKLTKLNSIMLTLVPAPNPIQQGLKPLGFGLTR